MIIRFDHRPQRGIYGELMICVIKTFRQGGICERLSALKPVILHEVWFYSGAKIGFVSGFYK
jgi:hypothetical protein